MTIQELKTWLEQEMKALGPALERSDGWGDSDSNLIRHDTLKEILDKITSDD